MEQNPPWEANNFSSSQEITLILYNPKVYLDVQNRPPFVSILSQINPFQAPILFLEDPF